MSTRTLHGAAKFAVELKEARCLADRHAMLIRRTADLARLDLDSVTPIFDELALERTIHAHR